MRIGMRQVLFCDKSTNYFHRNLYFWSEFDNDAL